MWHNIYVKIGLIGNGIHSKRIQAILKKKKLKFFLYKPEKPNYIDESKFEKLKKCNVIFIISPNNTHYEYIKKLHKDRYIFCEKPPVNNKKELLMLKKIKLNKIFFNYNFRFMKISEIIMKKNKYKLGDLIYANLTLSHGLAKKREYKNNWRSNRKKCPKGVFEVVSIHYVDMINYLFKVKKIGKPKLLNVSKIGNSYDTSHVEIELEKQGLINIFTSYNSSYAKNLFFLFENGIIEQRDNNIKIKGPSMNLDKKGFFKPPKIIKKININEDKDYLDSLKSSISFFLDHVKKKQIFDKKILNCSVKSNSLIL